VFGAGYSVQTGEREAVIVLQAGTHSEAIRMRYMDFAALVFQWSKNFIIHSRKSGKALNPLPALCIT